MRVETIKKKFLGVPGYVIAGVAAAMIIFLSVSSLNAVALPWGGTADSKFHLDYVYQITNGTLPAPYGLMYSEANPGSTEKYNTDSRQYASAHPPLYYYINSLLVGDLLKEGHYKKAITTMRAFNILIGAMTILVMAWGVWNVVPKRWYRDELTVALPAIVSLISPFIKAAGDIYNDILITFFSVAATVLACLFVKHGFSKKLLAMITAVLILGMLTKATMIATVLIVFAAVICRYVLEWRKERKKSVRYAFQGIVVISVLVVVIVLSSSWFYARNFQSSGSWFRSTEKAQLQERQYKSLADNLKSENYWMAVPASLFDSKEWKGIFIGNQTASKAIFITCLIAVMYVAMRRRKFIFTDKKMGVIIGLVTFQFVLFYGVQLQHATGWGQISARYFLPAILPIGLILSVGALIVTKKIWFQGVTLLVMLLCLASIVHISWYLELIYTDSLVETGLWGRVIEATRSNGFPILLPYLLLCTGVLGIGAISFVMYKFRQRAEAR